MSERSHSRHLSISITLSLHPAIASQHYRTLELKSRVESAGPHGLVALLYEELLRALDLAIARGQRGELLPGNASVAKAQSIFIALETSLDFDGGGELAATLGRIYRAGRASLQDASKTSDGTKLQEIRDAVSDIAYAWQSLAD